MSSIDGVVTTNKPAATVRHVLWTAQLGAILRLEVRKNFLGFRSILIYLLALAPIPMLALVSLFGVPAHEDPVVTISRSATLFAGLYEGLILRTVVFFGCAWMFMNLFRGEVVDKSLHYYLLAPVRREVLLAGKYISGLMVAVVLFTTTTFASYYFMYVTLDSPANAEYLQQAFGRKQGLAYVGITILACVGYGAIFMLIGLIFRNPIIPAVVLYGWEFINFLLPPFLKRLSVIFYLDSLAPIPISQGPLAIIAEPPPAWVSVGGLLVVSAILIFAGAYKLRRSEIKYHQEN